MKPFLSLSLLMICQFLFSQIKFEKGYYIDNENTKHNVFIKNIDWLNNPTEFVYKTDENSQENIGNLKDVKEFGVDGYKKLIRYQGNIDYSTDDLSKLSTDKNPEYKQKEVFLYELVSGNLSLYSYRDKVVNKFFYSGSDKNIVELEYKRYYSENDQSMMITNSRYKTQLEKLMSDNPDALKKIKTTNYNSQDLSKAFNLYNNITTTTKNKGKINLRIRPGVTFTNFKMNEDPYLIYSKLNYGTKAGFRIGMEFEWIMPFNKNKWGIIFEPSFMNYKSEAEYQSYTSNVKYSTLDFGLGLRHYFFLNNDSKFFINGQIVISSSFNEDSEVAFKYTYTPTIFTENKLDVSTKGASFAFGAGYNYKKLSIEAKVNTKRNITSDYVNWNTNFNFSSIILGYNIF